MVEDKAENVNAPKNKRERSPGFPFIPLKTAIARLIALDEYSKRHPVPAKHSGQAWGMKGYTSQAQQTLAALKYFGLVEYQGAGSGLTVVLSDEGRTYLRAQQESIKNDAIKRFALKPKVIAKYFEKWGVDRPADPICLDELVLKDSFNENGAKQFLGVYDETIGFARLRENDKGSDPSREEEKEDEVLPTQVKVGDYVQWTSNGVDQFKAPRKVVGVFPDGLHVQVFGSNSGVPVSELTVVDPPAASSRLAGGERAIADMSSEQAQGDNHFSILQTGGRLQISADVDLEGIAELKDMLKDYESILARLANKKVK